MDKFVPLAWHPYGPDPFETSEAYARASFYGVLGTPVTVFDGKTKVEGGSSSTYGQYMTTYNSCRSVPSHLTITYLAKSYSGNHASVKIEVKLEENIPSGNSVYIILWEDKCQNEGQTFRFVERLQPAPVALTITQKGQKQTIKKEFTLGGSWAKGNLGVSSFVQKNSDKSVLNGKAVKLISGVDVAPSSWGRVKALYE